MAFHTRHSVTPERQAIITERIKKLAEGYRTEKCLDGWDEVAEAFGLSRSGLSNLMLGARLPSLGAVILICELTDTDPGWLLGFREE